MKTLLFIILLLSIFIPKDKLPKSVWIHTIGKGCIDRLTFLSNGKITEYDCEMNYKFSGTYIIQNDIIYLKIKDDSHPEDGGKITYYKETYIMKANGLYLFNTKSDKKSDRLWFKRIK